MSLILHWLNVIVGSEQKLDPSAQWAIITVVSVGVGASSVAILRLYRGGNQQTVVTDASIAEFVTHAAQKIEDLEHELQRQREENRRCERRFNTLLRFLQRTPSITIPSEVEEELWRDG